MEGWEVDDCDSDGWVAIAVSFILACSSLSIWMKVSLKLVSELMCCNVCYQMYVLICAVLYTFILRER